MPGLIRVGVGGWTYEPWRGVFYPADLPQKRELEFASRALTSIEINGTYYSTFKPDIWRKWRDETPEGFKFSVKASRYCTNRKVLAEMGPSMERFLAQGLTELGDKLGPINWEFATTKTFDAGDFGAFLTLLPRTRDGVALRHAVEVRHPSFAVPGFYELARKHGVAIVYAVGKDYPEIGEATAGFHLRADDDDARRGRDRDHRRRLQIGRGQGARLGQAWRCVRVLHLRRKGAQPSRGPNAHSRVGRTKAIGCVHQNKKSRSFRHGTFGNRQKRRLSQDDAG